MHIGNAIPVTGWKILSIAAMRRKNGTSTKEPEVREE